MHCSRQELVRLARKWDALGACRLIPTSLIDPSESVGLFAVSKDEEYDRLIVNPTVINSRCFGCNSFTKTLAPGHLAGAIRLRDDEKLVISSDDLCEFYYTFIVSEQRAARNAIGVVFKGKELEHLSCYSSDIADTSVYICLATLAMGDSLAVEIAQTCCGPKLGACYHMRSSNIERPYHGAPSMSFLQLMTILDCKKCPDGRPVS